MRNQQRILGIHNHQVLNADQRNEFLGTVDVVVPRFDREMAVGLGNVSIAVAEQPGLHLVLVERSPGTQIVPAELCRQAIEMRKVFPLRRAWLENRVIHRNVFALRIQLVKDLFKLRRSVGRGNLLQAAERSRADVRARHSPACFADHRNIPEFQ